MTTSSPATAAYEARIELERELESITLENWPWLTTLLHRAAAELRKDREQDQASDKIGAELDQQLAAAKVEIARLKAQVREPLTNEGWMQACLTAREERDFLLAKFPIREPSAPVVDEAMVERAARLICAAEPWAYDPDGNDQTMSGGKNWLLFKNGARIALVDAIAALRAALTRTDTGGGNDAATGGETV
jgi:hypothetical protein